MARPKGVKQKRNESKYWLPEGVSLNLGQGDDYNKETKLVFTDTTYGEFTSYFKALQDANASTHPMAIKARREATNLAKYGTTNPGANKEVKLKREATMLSKYGVAHAGSVPELKQKAKETMIERYGVERPLQCKEIVNKMKDKLVSKYGTDNVMKIPAVKSTLAQTLYDKYGYTNPMEVPEFRQKQLDNIPNQYKSIVLPNGKKLADACREKNMKNHDRCLDLYQKYGGEITQLWIDNYPKLTTVEVAFKDFFPEATFMNRYILPDLKYKPDFKINDRLFVDVDGLFIHSEALGNKAKDYHLIKNDAFTKKGLKLLQFREDELITKSNIVKSIVNAKQNKFSFKYVARKLQLKPVSSINAREFFIKTHLMGYTDANHIGLFDNEELICCLGFKKHKDGVDITRFATKLNTIVVGGLSKLLKYIEREIKPSFIQSYVDLRYGTGSSLINLGFSQESVTLGWKWTDGKNTFNRLRCRANMDERRLSEREYANELGWYKIYDAGQAKFILRFKK